MIKFQELRWGNAFSYGPKNTIRLDDASLTQLVGKNGNGKSTIALLIEEVLYNTNSKKIRKADIINRYTKDKSYFIELDFDKDGTQYSIRTTRTSSTSSVVLVRGDTDISGHTATTTYKTIEGIIGFDHKTFSQIVYQSSVSSLEFLTATDTARKKFLIELLNLTKYTQAAELFKEKAAAVSKQLDVAQAKTSTVESWLAKLKTSDLQLRGPLAVEPEQPFALTSKISELETSLNNIESTNARINKNNTYRKVLSGIVIGNKPETPGDSSEVVSMQASLQNKEKRLLEGKALAGTTATSTCKTCSQSIDNTTRFNMFTQFSAIKGTLEEDIKSLKAGILEHNKKVAAYAAYTASISEFEKYTSLADPDMPMALLDAELLKAEIATSKKEVTAVEKEILLVRQNNRIIDEHNAKVAVLVEQMAEMKVAAAEGGAKVTELSKELSTLQVLVKAFSTTGLVAYKIECLVKDLEALTNEYLAQLAGGRFQLSFKITSSDKLNVVITDNGRDIDILALSSGERARVNVATLLAIRKLMQSLSNSRTNLLILDETVENLDAEGKERLIEVLLEEESLNTFLISHGFSHPLLDKINIVKENNISRIE